jgi:xanthine dehydrogenase YagS FAD-binding subunit
VAQKPWHSSDATAALTGKPATAETFQHAATLALKGGHGYADNTFKIELAKQCIVRALTQAAQGVQA